MVKGAFCALTGRATFLFRGNVISQRLQDLVSQHPGQIRQGTFEQGVLPHLPWRVVLLSQRS
jgi:hypothetical protein